MKSMKRHHLTGGLLLTALCLCLSCVSRPSSYYQPAQPAALSPGAAPAPDVTPSPGVTPERRTLLRTEPGEKPAWADTAPKSGEELFFVGVSRYYGAVADARDDARDNAYNQVLRFYGEFIQSSSSERTSFSGSSGERIDALLSREAELTRFAQGVVSQVGADRYYTEIYLNGNNEEEYVVYVLCQIPRRRAEEDIANFAKTASERYGGALLPQESLYGALKSYDDTLESLERNPLHRAVAYYDSPGGRVGLYDYVNQRLQALAASVSFEALPDLRARKPEVIDTLVRLKAPGIVGSLDCSAAVYGMNNPSPTVVYTVSAESGFSLKILTEKLEPGKYTVRLELLLNRVSGRIARNPTAGFSFEVRPAGAALAYRGMAMSGAERAAISRSVLVGLQAGGAQVRLEEPGGEASGGYGFVVTIDSHRPSAASDLVQYEVSMAFLVDGAVIRQSETKRFTEISRNHAINQIAGLIGNDGGFFRGVKEILE